MRATWYLLEDGTAVAPNECTTVDGVLTHKSGAAVAMRSPDCPMSTGVDLDESGAASSSGNGGAAPASDGSKATTKPKPTRQAKPKDMQAAKPGAGYKTRQTKAR